MTQRRQLIISFLLLSVAFIIVVPATDIVVSLFLTRQSPAGAATAYSLKEVISGTASEVLRALITCYLYSTTIGKGSTPGHGIKYGLLYSALIASLYIVLGGFYFKLKDPVLFVVLDSLILFVQGVVSGLLLYLVFRKPVVR